MSRAYDADPPPRWHLTDLQVLECAAVTVVGIWAGWLAAVAAALVLWATHRRAVPLALAAVLGVVGCVAGHHAWSEATPRHLAPFTGWARLAADPTPAGTGLRVTLQMQGERFDAFVYGTQRAQFATHQSGEYAWVVGRRLPLTRDPRRSQVRHVVGRFAVDVLGDVVAGNPLATASNRVRSALRRAANRSMAPADATLFTGLVIGDDAQQPPWLIDDFRASGLSHLTAVSGQNVSYMLAAALPLLRRLRPWWRWAATVGLIAWFMALTRFEPSVLRAGAMAMLAATAFVLGRQPHPLRLVASAVVVLTLGDPLLVWSVGFWLSVCATIGVCAVAPWLVARLAGPHWLRLALGVTLGAQAGVALPSLLVFHRLPVISVPANLAAVPVAGFVMLYGLPAGLVASVLPGFAASTVMLPSVVGTRWVSTVAQVAAAAEPPAVWAAGLWVVGGVALVLHLRRRSRAPAGSVPI